MKRFLLFCFIPFCCFGQDYMSDTVSIDYNAYHVAWSRTARYPVKVYWRLTSRNVSCMAPIKRSNRFTADPENDTEPGLLESYAGSSYDRGHNFSARDAACLERGSYDECWYDKNITPQTPALNRGAWLQLEKYCRYLVQQNDDLFIECGSIGKQRTIGNSEVWVPTHCWKVIYHTNEDPEAFLIPNDDDVGDFRDYSIRVGKLEEITGLSLQ